MGHALGLRVMEFLRDLRAAKFMDVRAIYYRSEQFGYLGSDLQVFVTRKA